MWKQLIVPFVALGAATFAAGHVIRSQQAPPIKAPLVAPPQSPFARTVAASGLVEARTENIAVGSHVPGVVVEVPARVGQEVRAGDVLFRLDDRRLRAELALRESSLAAAEAQLARLAAMPRPEEVPAAEAKVREMEASLADMADLENRARQTSATGATAVEEFNRRRQAAEVARQQLARSRAELALLRAGAWAPDVAVARAAVEEAKAQRSQTQIELDRLVATAPIAGRVLQVNVRPGEHVAAPSAQPLIVLGDLAALHVRADVDENDIHRLRPEGRAIAALRGDPWQTYSLGFVRVEPFVVPKKSLTGDVVERVDTRVLQVIYRIQPRDRMPFVGQQLDVFIEEAAPAGNGDQPASPALSGNGP